MTKHAATPWRFVKAPNGWRIDATHEDGLAHVSRLQDAAFIVTACNFHDDLVKEVAHWKGLYEDEKRDHEATLKRLNEESEAPL